jgi:glutathione S-transferase
MLKIYGVPISVHTRKVILAAKEKGIAYENEAVIPFSPPPGWGKLSPTGKIPVVTDGDLDVPDSSVICAYLERTRPSPPLYPSDTRDYVQSLWFEEFADGTIFREVIHGLFFQKVIRPGILEQATDQAVIDGILEDAMPKHFSYLEATLTGPHLAGGRFSIADIATMSNLINYHYLGYRLETARFPRLARYFASHLQRPAIREALSAEQPVADGMGLDRGFQRELQPA